VVQLDNFEGQVTAITGAGSGFGKLLAETLSASGAKLVLSDVNEEALRQVASALSGDHTALVCDVTREDDVAGMISAAQAEYGRLDILVNNAGLGSPPKLLTEVTEEELDLNYNVNTKGVFFGIKHGIRQMLAQDPKGGVILNVSSMAGIGGAPLLGPYAAAKHGVVGLTKTAACEFARHGVRVNAICPYFSPTPLVTQDEDFAARVKGMAANSPMARMGDPQEIVTVMLMLMSPANSFMNGQAIAVDGGMSAI